MGDTTTQTPRAGWRAAFGVFLQRHTLVMVALGFAAGLPNFLIFDTLSAWLRADGLSLETIAFFSLATLAYAFKFLWAPLLDRTTIPGLTSWLGHRRSWMLVAQVAIIAGLALIALSNPAKNLVFVAVLAVLTGFSSASQDIVIDAWRIEAAGENEQGAMAAAYAWGYRVALVIAGAVPLLLADQFGWSVSYGVMALLMGVGVLAVFLAPRERAHQIRPMPDTGRPARPMFERIEWIIRLAVLVVGAVFLGSGLSGKPDLLAAVAGPEAGTSIAALWRSSPTGNVLQLVAVIVGLAVIVVAAYPLPGTKTRPSLYLSHAFGEPLRDFFTRFEGAAVLILALICCYRISDFVLNLMNPFYLDLGFTLTEIAEVRKIFGVVMSMLGVFLGGLAVARWGLMGPLLVGAIAGPLSNLVFAWLATQGPSVFALTIAIGVDNVSAGFSGTCLIAYMSSLTASGFTATQYALFSSLYALPGKFIAALSGRIVEGAARSAESGGLFAPLKTLFVSLPDGALVSGAVKAAVSPAALGAGYVAFFFYTSAIGIIALVLTFCVASRRQVNL
jgi:MFS transporter, PAT family, beta-lactamase induction signal transducer AmpG